MDKSGYVCVQHHRNKIFIGVGEGDCSHHYSLDVH